VVDDALMRDARRGLLRVVIIGLVLIVGVGFGFFLQWLPAGSAGDRLAAAGGVLGGLLGAVGAALAVYLTLDAQRRDEAEKVEAALRMEVAELHGSCGATFRPLSLWR